MKWTRFLLLLLSISLLAGCGQRSDEQFEPKRPLTVYINARGDSMLPTLPNHHLALTDVAFPYSKLETGDVVILWDYLREGFTLHRLVSKQGPWFIAKGDNPETNPRVDRPFVTPSNYIGKYVGPQNIE